jgi:hypothetical protein
MLKTAAFFQHSPITSINWFGLTPGEASVLTRWSSSDMGFPSFVAGLAPLLSADFNDPDPLKSGGFSPPSTSTIMIISPYIQRRIHRKSFRDFTAQRRRSKKRSPSWKKHKVSPRIAFIGEDPYAVPVT